MNTNQSSELVRQIPTRLPAPSVSRKRPAVGLVHKSPGDEAYLFAREFHDEVVLRQWFTIKKFHVHQVGVEPDRSRLIRTHPPTGWALVLG